ncbi:MAG: hypothetical protein OXE80_05470 [Gammaproteobacteria bacterium]|nr:hypothetical protein [Gammaproteobacteria bacterium]
MNATRTLIQAFLGGLVVIVGLRTLVAGLTGATLAAFAAVAIIGLVGWRYHKAFENAEERQIAGDNLYYLGLLFTLISLILALVQLFVLDTQEDVNQRANELIGNFSVALFSTVAGIFARILFQSHKNTTTKSEGKAVEKPDPTPVPVSASGLVIDADVSALREELSRLRLMLREASDAFLHFTRISSEQSENMVEHTGSMVQRQSEELSKATIHQLQQMNQNLQSVANVFQVEMEKLSNHSTNVIDEFVKHMSADARRGIADTSQAWNEAAIKMRAEGDKQIRAIYGDINALLQSTEQAWAQMAGLSESIGESVAGMRQNVESLREMLKDSVQAGAEMKLLVESMGRAREDLDRAAGAAGKSTAEIESGIREFAEIQGKLSADLNESRLQAVQEFRDATTRITDQVGEELDSGGGRLQSAILNIVNDMENHQKVSAEQLGKASHLSRQMSEETKQWSKLAEHTRKSLVEAVEHLVSVVKKN